MKIIALSALLAIGLTAGAQAQTTVESGSASGAYAGVNNYNVFPGGNGGGGNGVGYLNTNQSGTLWVLGNTPSTSATSYDACTKNVVINGPGVGLAIPLEIDMCWKMRQMDAMAKYPPGSNQYEMGCADSGWLQVDWATGTMACTANKAKLAKANPSDPRSASVQGVPVVMPGVGNGIRQPLPPTVVPVTATNAQPSLSQAPAVDYSRRCNRAAGIVEQCTSG